MKKRTIFNKNEIFIYSNYCEVILYNRFQAEIAIAKIDKEDYYKVKNYKWCITSDGYVMNGKNRIKLHQLILGNRVGHEIDHINHDKLDNRKQNLRHCTRSQNSMNRKDVKGYCWNKINKKWQVFLTINYKNIHLGFFNKEKDAINARKQAERKYFGEFAR